MSLLTCDLVERVAEIIPRYNMLSQGDRLGVAVSGGADSIALLHILHRLSSRLGVILTVLHVNHHLRGEESESDEAFVRSVAQELELDIVVSHAPVPGGNLEQEARLLRRQFFFKSLENGAVSRVAVGHTRTDQAETVLLRLFRGSGLTGLAGMRPVSRDGIIRPLLSVSRTEVREWAGSQGLRWRDDSSNGNTSFDRNRLRAEIFPTLKTFNPRLESVLAGTAALAADEEDYWIAEIERIYSQIAKRTQLGLIFQVAELRTLHRSVQRRVIRKALSEVRGDLRSIDLEHVEAVLRVCSSTHGHDRVLIPGVDAFRSFDTLLLAKVGELRSRARGYRIPICDEGKYLLPYGLGAITLHRIGARIQNYAKFETGLDFPGEIAFLDEHLLAPGHHCLELRNWEPGDRIGTLEHQQPPKVKELFQQHKIVLWERRHWPVLVTQNQIVWTRRFGAAATFRAKPEQTSCVQLEFHPADGESMAVGY